MTGLDLIWKYSAQGTYCDATVSLRVYATSFHLELLENVNELQHFETSSH